MSENIARRVVARGRVQGVFFRDGARREAQARGVAGWVQNNPDGSVEALFEGPRSDVDDLVAWASSGPGQAQVEDAQVTDEDPGGLTGFDVRG